MAIVTGTYQGGIDLSVNKTISLSTVRSVSYADRIMPDINATQLSIVTYKTVFNTGQLSLKFSSNVTSVLTTPTVQIYYNKTGYNATFTSVASNGYYPLYLSYANLTVGPPNVFWTSGITNSTIGTYTNNATVSNTSLVASTNDGPLTYTVTSGSLPPGLSIGSSTGTISGTVSYTGTTATTYSFTVTATSSSSQTIVSPFSITFNPSDPYFNYNSMVLHFDGTPTTVTTGTFIGSISGSILTITALLTGWLGPGSIITGTGIPSSYIFITSFGTGSYGSVGTYNISAILTVASTVITAQGSANNSIITDLSTNNMTIQRNVNLGAGTVSPFSQPAGYWSASFGLASSTTYMQLPTLAAASLLLGNSVAFNGTTQYLTIADNAALQMASGDFTIEAWYYQNNLTAIQTIFDKGYQTAGSLLIQTALTSGLLMINTGTTSGYSAVFNGTTNLLTTTANSLTTENFTIEAFFFLTSNLTYLGSNTVYTAAIVTTSLTNGFGLSIISSSNTSTIPTGISFYVIGTSTSPPNLTATNLFIPIGVWNHVAVSRNGTVYGMWLNGVRVATFSNSFTYTAGVITIGASTLANFLNWFPGYLSNVRIVKSVVAGYDPSSASITVPTATLTNVASTYLLACHAATFVDGSSNVFTVTATGSTVALIPNPFMLFMEPSSVSSQIIRTATWQHIAVTRSGTSLRVFRNGGQVGSTITNSTNFNSTVLMAIGAGLTSGTGITPGLYLNGNISSLRMIKGTALYTNNFLLPTAPFFVTSTYLPGTSLIACQASTIIDQSIANAGTGWSITNVNAATVSTTIVPLVTPNYLTITTDDFTIEAFAMRNVITSTGNILAALVNPNGAIVTVLRLNNGANGTWMNDFVLPVSVGSVTSDDRLFAYPGKWFHFAISRSSGQMYLHINGTQVASVYNSSTYSLNGMYIGSWNTVGNEWTGHISNFKVTKGSAIYAYNSSFTPPTTPLTATTNTALLLLSSYNITDNRSLSTTVNRSTFTITGAVSTSPLSPFTSYNNGIDKTFSPTANGGSITFDGTSGGWITIPNTTPLNLTNVPWTIECWIWPSGDYSTYRGIFAKRGASQSYQGWLNLTTGYISFANSSTNYISTTTPTPHTWSHVAFVYDGAYINIYLNGVKILVNATSISEFNAPLYIGGDSVAGEVFVGYISNFRIVKGTAVYTGALPVTGIISFTPPTTPLTAITNTVLLISATNNTAYDNASNTNYQLYASAGNTAGTGVGPFSISYYGGKSIFFNGTNDYITVGQPYSLTGFVNTNFYFGTGDWSVEMWVYFNTVTGTQSIIDTRPSGTAATNNYIVLQLVTGVLTYFTAAVTAITGPTLVASTWYHIAISRQFNRTRLFVNGVQQGQDYTDAQTYTTGLNRPIFGVDYTGTTNYISGYMDDIRITRFARYKGIFTIPTAALGDTSTDDANFVYNNLLVHGDGTNAQTNNTFLDATGTYSITKTGTPTQGTFTPFSRAPGYWSNYFATEYLLVQGAGGAASTSLTFGTGNWTIEGWFFEFSKTATTPALIATHDAGGLIINTWAIYYNTTTYANSIVVSIYNSGFTLSSGSTYINLGRWNHFAVVRNSNIVSIFVNGNLANSSNFVANMDNTVATRFRIGSYNITSGETFNGYISNLRVVKSAVYTTAFTPSTTPLTAIANTLVLTCQNNNFIDNSTNSWVVQPFGASGTSIQSANPFAISSAYSTSANSGSVYFNNVTTDYLTPQVGAVTLASDFVIECWTYDIGTTATGTIFSWRSGPTSWTGLLLYKLTGFNLTLNINNGTTIVQNNNTYYPRSWQHVAVTRSGSTVRLYVNGVSVGTPATVSGAITLGTNTLSIGQDLSNVVAAFYLNGYISNFRFATGVSAYTGNILAPAPLVSTGATLLLSGINGGIIDSSSRFNLTTFGSTQVATTNKKYGTGSMFFNGTTDYVTISQLPDVYNYVAPVPVNGQFTIEAWIYISSYATMTIYGQWLNSDGNRFWFGIDNSSGYKLVFVHGTAGSTFGNTAVPLSQWVHVAVVRDGSNRLFLFLNGVIDGSAASYTSGLYQFVSKIGNIITTITTNYFSGYIDDLRISAIARYTTSFSLPIRHLDT